MSNKNENNVLNWFNKIKEKTLNIKNNFFKSNIKNNTSNINNNSTKSINIFKKIYLDIKNKKDNFARKLKKFFINHEINDIFFKKIEEHLLVFDFGYTLTQKIIKKLISGYQKKILKNKEDIYSELQKILFKIINIKNLDLYSSHGILSNIPHVILIIGVNGVGKTTTVAKLAYLYQKLGYKTMLSASDTFRAAAVDQLKIWGKKNNIPVFYNLKKSDPSAVIFDSIGYAQKKKIDILIIDTSGRLHNKIHLIEELKKNIRVIQNKLPESPQEIFLILDGCNGQNSINQTEVFYKELKKITGIIITKLDGTAKGGIIFSIIDKFHIPIKYIGVGEKIQDIYKFNAKEFINTFFKQY